MEFDARSATVSNIVCVSVDHAKAEGDHMHAELGHALQKACTLTQFPEHSMQMNP